MGRNLKIEFLAIIILFLSILNIDQGQKEHHPALPKHPGKLLNDEQIVRHYGSCIIALITSGSCNNPSFNQDTTCHRKWARRGTPPLLSHRVDESLLTYMVASHPRTRGVPQMGERRKVNDCLYQAGHSRLHSCLSDSDKEAADVGCDHQQMKLSAQQTLG
ncbi:hypothetical protein AVEN_184519-1 [Araneus ventricosus]|uniref:Uncharacterized protein n=1 Tax=Araneus ventricosus TaxID=182803 RepID=A0A4Y2QTA0_ARAVE|nr:hypothetical protein AVEN_184519-1 [Araneus ventricosus]